MLDSPALLKITRITIDAMRQAVVHPVQGAPIARALAATAIPATLAAWAAAALRAGRGALMEQLVHGLEVVLYNVQCSAPAPHPAPAAGAGAVLPSTHRLEEWYDHLATDVLPAIAQAQRAAYAAEGPAARLAAAMAEARALGALRCANPRCMRIVGCRERESRGKRCSGCMVSRYCCRECQVAGWKAHKGVCGALAAEREAAEAAGGSGEE